MHSAVVAEGGPALVGGTAIASTLGEDAAEWPWPVALNALEASAWRALEFGLLPVRGRVAVIDLLNTSGAPPDLIDAVQHARDREQGDAVRYFGETLPAGLRVDGG